MYVSPAFASQQALPSQQRAKLAARFCSAVRARASLFKLHAGAPTRGLAMTFTAAAAAADVVPRFEPCGLNQLYAMRYGTVPIAHSTGGLIDTIDDYNPFAKGERGAGQCTRVCRFTNGVWVEGSGMRRTMYAQAAPSTQVGSTRSTFCCAGAAQHHVCAGRVLQSMYRQCV
jgi:hypothetical protein